MVHIICDICKKNIPEATTAFAWDTKERNYKVFLDKSLCYPCTLKLEEEISNIMDENSEFGFLEHNKVLRSALNRLTE